MKINTLIVDDEPLARERIKSLLEQESDINIVGECAGGEDAIKAIGMQQPDLVFLDVQMPQIDGFDVLRAIDTDTSIAPIVVFVTAHNQYAAPAYDAQVLDYLVKPFKRSRLQDSLQRVRKQLQCRIMGRAPAEGAPVLDGYPGRLAVKVSNRVLFLKVEEIDFIEAAGNYALVHVGAQTHIHRETLNSLETKLGASRFLRISRSTIVNLERVREIKSSFESGAIVVLADGRQLALTRGMRQLREMLKVS
ncbi:MAG: response regulator [Verrucomicrobiae bacterium]|nr:response regulator [Verrucomicrobiae bacterium]